jgi:16S rRNA C967 or C1407 C5-methylase (RsmB/RsmF family)/NOL1/NOP2/fmu family ribosome biogenesis protein
MKLPETYCRNMKALLGGEWEAYEESFRKEPLQGLRVNQSKIQPEEFLRLSPFSLKKVPWVENGFFYGREDSPAKHPYYHAGLYYLQEPSAMTPASRLPVGPGDRVLDLCAAPGGKATELGARLKGKGMLVANDISASRARALLKNLEMAGIPNALVTAERPERLAERFPGFFDRILVDAPCSGEGMFRRDSRMAARWEENPPETYLEVQRTLTECAFRMLRPGGLMLYSTCTFSVEENENQILRLLERHPELSPVPAEPGYPGFAPGFRGLEEAVRIFPHRMEGEGHFLVLLRKNGCAEEREAVRERESRDRSPAASQLPESAADFLKLTDRKRWQGSFLAEGDQLYFLPEGTVRMPGLRYLRTGLLLGTRKKDRFEPSQALAMALDREGFDGILDLPSDDPLTVKYLKGETIPLTESSRGPSPWRLVCTDGFPLGWGKAAGNSLKNRYSPGWRWM